MHKSIRDQRNGLIMRFRGEGMKVRDIAKLLGMSIGGVEKVIYKNKPKDPSITIEEPSGKPQRTPVA